jgi:hypothetical protein
MKRLMMDRHNDLVDRFGRLPESFVRNECLGYDRWLQVLVGSSLVDQTRLERVLFHGRTVALLTLKAFPGQRRAEGQVFDHACIPR